MAFQGILIKMRGVWDLYCFFVRTPYWGSLLWSISYGAHCWNSTNSGISRVGMWAGCGAGKVRVACCWSTCPVLPLPCPGYQNTKALLSVTAIPPAETPAGMHIYREKELWKELPPAPGSFVFITGNGAWNNLRYLVTVLEKPLPVPTPLHPSKVNRKTTVA